MLIVGAGPCGLVAGITAAPYRVKVLVAEQRGGRVEPVQGAGRQYTRNGVDRCVDWVWRGRSVPAPPMSSRRALNTNVCCPAGHDHAAWLSIRRGSSASESQSRPAWTPQSHYEPFLLDLLCAASSATVQFGTRLLSLRGTRWPLPCDALRRGVGRDCPCRRPGSSSVAMGRTARCGARSASRWKAPRISQITNGSSSLPRSTVSCTVVRTRFTSSSIPMSVAPCWRAAVTKIDGVCHGNDLAARPGLEDLSQHQLAVFDTHGHGHHPISISLVERVSRFSFAAQYRRAVPQGRCVPDWDAAHRMTPRGGTGMNTQDAFDIAWKVAWVSTRLGLLAAARHLRT